MTKDKIIVTFTDRDGKVHKIPDASDWKGPVVGIQGWTCTETAQVKATGKVQTCGGATIHGTGKRIESYDTYASDAKCATCGTDVGIIRAKVPTLFGLEEDERIFSMGVKIY